MRGMSSSIASSSNSKRPARVLRFSQRDIQPQHLSSPSRLASSDAMRHFNAFIGRTAGEIGARPGNQSIECRLRGSRSSGCATNNACAASSMRSGPALDRPCRGFARDRLATIEHGGLRFPKAISARLSRTVVSRPAERPRGLSCRRSGPTTGAVANRFRWCSRARQSGSRRAASTTTSAGTRLQSETAGNRALGIDRRVHRRPRRRDGPRPASHRPTAWRRSGSSQCSPAASMFASMALQIGHHSAQK